MCVRCARNSPVARITGDQIPRINVVQIGELTALLAVKVGILRGVHSRDRSNDVRTVGQFKSSPEFALRVSRTLQALQFFDEIQAEVLGIMDCRGRCSALCGIAVTSGEIEKEKPDPRLPAEVDFVVRG